MNLKLSTLPETYCICRLNPNEALPSWIDRSAFWTVTQTKDELSIVCRDHDHIHASSIQRDWKIIKVKGVLDFNLTGILSSIAHPLAKVKISIFAISTFDTDYILVKSDNLDKALKTLESSGFTLE